MSDARANVIAWWRVHADCNAERLPDTRLLLIPHTTIKALYMKYKHDTA